MTDRVLRICLKLVLTAYAAGRFLQLWQGHLPSLVLVLFHVIPPACFAVLHGAPSYGRRAISVFVIGLIIVGGFFESLSLGTGFPFGHYNFTGLMGPKLLGLPPLLTLAYVGIGYAAWEVAIVLTGPVRLATPAVAALVMTAWDFAMDPVWADIDRAWVWHDGGAYFGVPASNYFGWLLCTFTFYSLFALYVRQAPRPPQDPRFRGLAVWLYTICAGGNLILLFAPHPAMVLDGTGRAWQASSVLATCVAVSLLLMGGIVLVAFFRLGASPSAKANLKRQPSR